MVETSSHSVRPAPAARPGAEGGVGAGWVDQTNIVVAITRLGLSQWCLGSSSLSLRHFPVWILVFIGED